MKNLEKSITPLIKLSDVHYNNFHHSLIEIDTEKHWIKNYIEEKNLIGKSIFLILIWFRFVSLLI
jgi:hypothetical protein